jgi:hypothetical protein
MGTPVTPTFSLDPNGRRFIHIPATPARAVMVRRWFGRAGTGSLILQFCAAHTIHIENLTHPSCEEATERCQQDLALLLDHLNDRNAYFETVRELASR